MEDIYYYSESSRFRVDDPNLYLVDAVEFSLQHCLNGKLCAHINIDNIMS